MGTLVCCCFTGSRPVNLSHHLEDRGQQRFNLPWPITIHLCGSCHGKAFPWRSRYYLAAQYSSHKWFNFPPEGDWNGMCSVGIPIDFHPFFSDCKKGERDQEWGGNRVSTASRRHYYKQSLCYLLWWGPIVSNNKQQWDCRVYRHPQVWWFSLTKVPSGGLALLPCCSRAAWSYREWRSTPSELICTAKHESYGPSSQRWHHRSQSSVPTNFLGPVVFPDLVN